MNAEQLALYELHSAAVNYIWTFWLLSGRGKVPECRDWPEPEKKAYDRWLDANQRTTNQRRPTRAACDTGRFQSHRDAASDPRLPRPART